MDTPVIACAVWEMSQSFFVLRPVPSAWHYCPRLQPQLSWGQILPLTAQPLLLSQIRSRTSQPSE